MKPLRQFDLNLLVLFEALISECHVSRAAEKVFLSQSAMSHALNRLRDLLDDPLLVRTERGLQPTPRALQMLPQVREALQLVDKTLQPPTPFAPEVSERVFRIACSDYFETVVFPEWFSEIHKQAPNIRIEIALIGDEYLTSHLERGKIDLIVGLEAGQPLPKHLLVEPWLTERQLCLACENHPTAASELDLQAYLSLQHILFFDLEGETRSGIDQWLEGLGEQRSEIARATNYTAAARLASKSEAIITLPAQMARLFSQMLPLQVIEPPAEMPRVEMTIVQHPLYEDDPAIRWLKNAIKRYAQQLQSD